MRSAQVLYTIVLQQCAVCGAVQAYKYAAPSVAPVCLLPLRSTAVPGLRDGMPVPLWAYRLPLSLPSPLEGVEHMHPQGQLRHTALFSFPLSSSRLSLQSWPLSASVDGSGPL